MSYGYGCILFNARGSQFKHFIIKHPVENNSSKFRLIKVLKLIFFLHVILTKVHSPTVAWSQSMLFQLSQSQITSTVPCLPKSNFLKVPWPCSPIVQNTDSP